MKSIRIILVDKSARKSLPTKRDVFCPNMAPARPNRMHIILKGGGQKQGPQSAWIPYAKFKSTPEGTGRLVQQVDCYIGLHTSRGLFFLIVVR